MSKFEGFSAFIAEFCSNNNRRFKYLCKFSQFEQIWITYYRRLTNLWQMIKITKRKSCKGFARNFSIIQFPFLFSAWRIFRVGGGGLSRLGERCSFSIEMKQRCISITVLAKLYTFTILESNSREQHVQQAN